MTRRANIDGPAASRPTTTTPSPRANIGMPAASRRTTTKTPPRAVTRRSIGWPRIAALAGLIVLGPRSAAADPCRAFRYGMPTGPVLAPLLDGGLGRAHRVCGRSEIAVRGGGLLAIDKPNFYGRVTAGLNLEGSYAPTRTTEVFAGLEALRFDTVISSLAASRLGLGHTYLGAAHRSVLGERTSLGVNGKLVLPTAPGLYHNAWPVSVDLGFAGQFTATRRLYLHGQIGLLATFVASRIAPSVRLGAALTGGAEFLPIRRLAIAADLHTLVGYTDVLDAVAGAVALRTSGLRRFGLELAGTFPFAGRLRTQAAVMLRVSVYLGSLTTPPRARLRAQPL